MAHRVTSSMDFYKFCLIAFLIFNNGFPIKGVPESHSAGLKSPSVKECRAHIEAALDKYWDTSEDKKDRETAPDSMPDQSTKFLEVGPQREDEIDQEDSNTDPPVDVQDKDEAEEDEDDTDEDDEDENDEDEEEDEDDTEKPEEKPKEDLDTDDEDDEEDEDEEDETSEEETSPSTKPDEEEDAEDEEDEDEDDEDEEDEDEEDEDEALKETEDETEEEEDEAETLKEAEDETEEEEETEEEDEDEESDDGEEEKGEISQREESKKDGAGDDAEVSEKQKEEEDDEEEDDEVEEEEEEEEREEEIHEVAEEEEEEEDEKEKEEEEEDEKEKEEEEEEEEEEKEEEEKEEEEAKQEEPVEEEEDEEEEEEEEDDGEEEEAEEEEETETISLQEDTAGGKVTGETHSAPGGMAPELSATEPDSDKPEASPVEEKAALESPPEEAEEEDEEEDEEEETGEEDEDEDLIENIYEEEDEEDLVATPGETLRSRDHVDAILGLDDIGTNYDLEEEKLAQSVFRDIKKIHTASVKPMEMLYKYADSTTRVLGDAEIFSKPMVLFLGPWSSGKTTIINYLLGLERTPAAFKTGTGITDLDFTAINYGEQRRVTSGTALAAEWTYAGVQKFGQGFLDHFKGVTIPHTLFKKITLVDTPGIIESKKNDERGYPFNDAFQWFIDRADAIYVVLDPTKVDIGAELGSVLDQLKGREVRFILNKADTIKRSDLMRVVGQLFWNLSPLMSSTEAPVIYAVSLTTKPFHPSAPARFLADQEKNFLYDLRDTIDKHVENRIRYARRHAVRVRNHCKMVDCYLSTYYRHKSIFSSKKNVAQLITENPNEYNIYEGLSSMTNVSRYDLPDPVAYKSFFRMHPLYDFKPLASTCSYFRGCPMDKLDIAISNELPELLAKYKKSKLDIPAPPAKEEGR